MVDILLDGRLKPLFNSEERFKKSSAGQTQEDGEEAEENERLADFEKWPIVEGESN